MTVLLVSLQALGTMVAIYIPAAPGSKPPRQSIAWLFERETRTGAVAALLTRTLLKVWACEEFVPKQFIA